MSFFYVDIIGSLENLNDGSGSLDLQHLTLTDFSTAQDDIDDLGVS